MKPLDQYPTPETDAVLIGGGHLYISACDPHVKANIARKLERERDEARTLCRWALPRLRAMCHDFGATGTGCRCVEEMESHPEIFPSANPKRDAHGDIDKP